jgi:hypothetical protein
VLRKITRLIETLAFPIIFLSSVVILSIDASISQVADFLVEENTSAFGISIFIFFCALLGAFSVVLFRYIRRTTSVITNSFLPLRLAYYISLVTQFVLTLILIAIIIQIVLLQEYATILLIFTEAIAYWSAASISIISAIILFSWFRISKGSYITLIYCIAFGFNVYCFLYLPIFEIPSLVGKDQVITPDSEVVYETDSFLSQEGGIREIFFDIYNYLSTGVFLIFVIGSATMLHHYARKMGRIKFWVLLLLPLVFYVGNLVDIIGLYVPQTDDEFFYYYLYSSLRAVAGGGLLGFAFWSVSNALGPNKAVMSYLRLCAYGFILNSVAVVGSISAAPYPPFGIVSMSILTLSTYLIILGLYSTAVSISQDVKLRQYVRKLTRENLGFLSNIGQAQMEREIQSKASDLESVVKEQRIKLEKESGIQSSVQEQDIKQYLLEVLQEVDKHKSSS